MGIANISQKIVDSVHAAYAVRNTKGTVIGSLEYPWYLPYNLLLNDTFSGSKHLVVNSQHWIPYIFGKKKGRPIQKKLIPDYVLIHVLSSGSKTEIRTVLKIFAVVEIKALSTEIDKTVEKKDSGREIRNVESCFKEAEDQAMFQAQAALAGTDQTVIFALVGAGPYWTYQIYHWVDNQKDKRGRPVLRQEYEQDHPICKLTDIDNGQKISKKTEELIKMFQKDINRYFGQELL